MKHAVVLLLVGCLVIALCLGALIPTAPQTEGDYDPFIDSGNDGKTDYENLGLLTTEYESTNRFTSWNRPQYAQLSSGEIVSGRR